MSSFQSNMTVSGQTALVTMSGPLDENSRLDRHDFRPYAEIQFDLRDISRVNSRGVRLWFKWTRGLDQNKKYSITHLPRVLVAQANLVQGLIPKFIKVCAIELPYYCERCGISVYSYWNLMPSERLPSPQPDPPSCAKCDQNTVLDASEDSYFNFLKGR